MTDCLIWTGDKNTPNGYGRRMINGVRGLVHRQTWEQHYGPIPEGLEVRHTCDVRACYEITHLVLGTHQDNMDDMVRRGRSRRGTAVPQSKLTPEQVREIRERRARGERQCDLAEEFGVARPTISTIVHRKTWASV